MRQIFKKKGTWVVLAALIIAMISAITLSVGGSDVFSRATNAIMKPVKSVVTSMVDGLEELYRYMYDYDRLEAENAELKVRISQLEDEYREYTEVSEENDRLRALAGLSERNANFEYAEATIISWSASSWGSSFTISKGTDDGLEKFDCVINEYGYIIGQITDIGPSSATVTTIIDSSLSVGAMVAGSDDTGVASGDFSLMKSGLLKLEYVSSPDKLVSGDTIVTSGAGGVFPRGLVLGYVEEMTVSASGTGTYAEVRPAAELEELVYVYVIIDF